MADEQTVVEEVTTDTTAPQGKETQEGTTSTEDQTKVTQDREIPEELDLDWIEKDEDGQHVIRRGSSVYKGKTAKEALDNLLKGVEEKDKTIAKFKAEGAIKAPKIDFDPNQDADSPPPPAESEFVRDFVKKKGIDPEKLYWKRAQWDSYQDEQGLRDRHVIEEQQEINRVINQARKEYQNTEASWYRGDVLKRSEKAVVKFLTRIGVENPDEYADDYHAVIQELFADGKVPEVDDIIIELGARVQKSLTPKQESKLQQQLAAKLEEEKKRTKGIKAPGSGGQFNTESKKPMSIREAGQAASKAIRAGRL